MVLDTTVFSAGSNLICCSPTVRYLLLTQLTYSAIILSARVLLKPKVLSHRSTSICRGNDFLNFVRRYLKIMPRVVVQRSQIITKSVMLTIGNLENLYNQLVYRLTITALMHGQNVHVGHYTKLACNMHCNMCMYIMQVTCICMCTLHETCMCRHVLCKYQVSSQKH